MNNTNTIQSVTKNKKNDIEINTKMFYFPDKNKNILKMCSELLSKLIAKNLCLKCWERSCPNKNHHDSGHAIGSKEGDHLQMQLNKNK